MQTTGNLMHEPRQTLTTPVYVSLPHNSCMTTAEGGRLVFQSDRARDPADGPPEVAATCLASVSPIPRQGPQDPNLFALTTAITDETGRLWERTRNITVVEIWRTILARHEFYQLVEPASDCLSYHNLDNLKSVTRRLLLEPEDTLCDMRERHFVEVVRKRQENQERSPGTPARIDETERLLFRLKFKYFSAAIGLLVERRIFLPPNIQPPFRDELVITIRPASNPKSIVTVHGSDDEIVLPVPSIGFAELGTLCIRQAYLSAGWEMPAKELPRASDLTLWQQGYHECGIAIESIRALMPNPAIRYEPCSKC